MGRNYTDALEFLLDGEAESVSNGRCTNLTPSKELQHLWARWGAAMVEALHIWERNYPQTLRAPIGYLLTKEQYADYDVFQTLDGAGVGIWDGRWDDYFVDRNALKALEKYLKQVLHKAFGTMKDALTDEAMTQCEDKKPKQRTLFS